VRASVALAVCALASAGPGMAQQAWNSVPLGVLPRATVISTEGFTRVQALHELSDGRIIVLDADERSIHVLSADLAPVATIGRDGSGPGSSFCRFGCSRSVVTRQESTTP
jgi:hypothetical protein